MLIRKLVHRTVVMVAQAGVRLNIHLHQFLAGQAILHPQAHHKEATEGLQLPQVYQDRVVVALQLLVVHQQVLPLEAEAMEHLRPFQDHQ
jgi:hypothetical protein